MSGKWPGGIISKTAPTVTGGEFGSASGIWTLDQVAIMRSKVCGLNLCGLKSFGLGVTRLMDS